jgi:hypothetical protein
MPPARTFQEDPNYMVLYYSYVTAMESASGKTDFNVVKAKTGYSSAAAA